MDLKRDIIEIQGQGDKREKEKFRKILNNKKNMKEEKSGKSKAKKRMSKNEYKENPEQQREFE